MKTILCLGLLVCVCMMYTLASPLDIAEAAPPYLEAVQEESLQPEESAYRGYRGYGGGGYGGWGNGGGGWGQGGGGWGRGR